MKEFEKKIKKLEESCLKEIKKSKNLAALEEIRIAYLGRKGTLTALTNELKEFSLEKKRITGPLLYQVKQTLHNAYEIQKQRLEKEVNNKEKFTFDVTAYKPNQLKGSLHIYTRLIENLSAIFTTMGYTIAEGPEVDSEYYNFTALNIPKTHPARDSHDTFWLLNPDRLLRTHASSIQVHTMEQSTPPFAIFAPGRAYRNEATDATHGFMFTQGELLYIDKNVSMAHLLATAQTFLQTFFESQSLKIRVRPGYFPFVEPGIEIDGSCPFCSDGCAICKKTGWIELLGAGLVHPNVLKMSGINTSIYNGFALGFGIERLAMIKYGIHDIRLFHSASIPFLNQF